jgi:hypothetical protein
LPEIERPRNDLASRRIPAKPLTGEGPDRVAVIFQIRKLDDTPYVILTASLDVVKVILAFTARKCIDSRDHVGTEPLLAEFLESHGRIFDDIVQDCNDLRDSAMLVNALHHANRVKDVRPAGFVELVGVRLCRDANGTGKVSLRGPHPLKVTRSTRFRSSVSARWCR